MNSFKQATDELLDNALITTTLLTDGRYAYAMLSPIKELSFDYSRSHRRTCIGLLSTGLLKIYEKANRFGDPERYRWNLLAIEHLDSAMGFIKGLLPDEPQLQLASSMHNHYQFSIVASLEVLRQIIGLKNVSCEPSLIYTLGDMELWLCKIGEIKRLDGEAVGLLAEGLDGNSLAKMKLSLGDLERRLGNVEEARGLYTEAEGLYKEEKSGFGLANIKLNLGYLEKQQLNYPASIEYFSNAFTLFEKVQDVEAKSMVAAELSCAYALNGDCINAAKWLAAAESLSTNIMDLWRLYFEECLNETPNFADCRRFGVTDRIG